MSKIIKWPRRFFSRLIKAIGKVISAFVRRIRKLVGARVQPTVADYITTLPSPAHPPSLNEPFPPSPEPLPQTEKLADATAASPAPLVAPELSDSEIESAPPITFTVERIENGYRASGPLKSGWYINVGIEGDTVRSNAPYLKASDPNGTEDWPFEWTDRDPNWIPAPPPVKWFFTHSDYEPHLAAPIGGIKEIYKGSIDADGKSWTEEIVVEVNTQEKEDARRAKSRKVLAQIKKKLKRSQ